MESLFFLCLITLQVLICKKFCNDNWIYLEIDFFPTLPYKKFCQNFIFIKTKIYEDIGVYSYIHDLLSNFLTRSLSCLFLRILLTYWIPLPFFPKKPFKDRGSSTTVPFT